MASYNVESKRSAAKELEHLPPKDRTRTIARIRALATDPRPAGCEKLSGQERYRMRQGNYRILYEIDAAVVLVIVVRIAHRREVDR